jgi:hypothetical protein
MAEFQLTIEASWRRYLRYCVRRSAMTPGQRAVTLALLNLWLHHRKGDKGYIHPGRAKIAKATRYTEKTVSRAMAVLREAGALRARKRLHGEGQHPTEYTMDLLALLVLCGAEIPEWAPGKLVEFDGYTMPSGNEVAGQVSHQNGRECPTTGDRKCPTAYSNGERSTKSATKTDLQGGDDEGE